MTRLKVQDVVETGVSSLRPREEVYLSARITKTRKARVVPSPSTFNQFQEQVLKVAFGFSIAALGCCLWFFSDMLGQDSTKGMPWSKVGIK